MGVVLEAIEQAERDEQPEGKDRNDMHRSPHLARSKTGDAPLDPFLAPFDFEHVRLDEREADRALGLLVVVSNVFG